LEKYAQWEGSITPAEAGKGDEQVQVQIYEMPVCEVRGELDGSGVVEVPGKNVYA
jgi:hypothetical protein